MEDILSRELIVGIGGDLTSGGLPTVSPRGLTIGGGPNYFESLLDGYCNILNLK